MTAKPHDRIAALMAEGLSLTEAMEELGLTILPAEPAEHRAKPVTLPQYKKDFDFHTDELAVEGEIRRKREREEARAEAKRWKEREKKASPQPLSRRRYQRGSLKDDGDRFILRWREDVLQDGQVKRVERREYLPKAIYRTKREAERESMRRLERVNSVDYKPVTSGTFEQFADRWQKHIMSQHKPGTQTTERRSINNLLATFGPLPMSAITTEDLQEWVTAQYDLGLMPKTVKNRFDTLKQMWKEAKAWGYASTDPCKGVKLKKWKKGDVSHFTLEQQLAIIEAAKGWHKIMFRLLGETGIRPGEAGGLRQQDVGHKSITVHQSVWDQEIQTPKSDAALRVIPISEGLAQQLKAHIEATGPNDYGLVFLNRAGRPLNMDKFRQKVLVPILTKLKIETEKQAGLYAFRHGQGKLLDSIKAPLKVRQARMGHTDIETTLLHYTPEEDVEARMAAEQLGSMYDTPGRVQ